STTTESDHAGLSQRAIPPGGASGRVHFRPRLPLWRRRVRDDPRAQRAALVVGTALGTSSARRPGFEAEDALAPAGASGLRREIGRAQRDAGIRLAPESNPRLRASRLFSEGCWRTDDGDDNAPAACTERVALPGHSLGATGSQ